MSAPTVVHVAVPEPEGSIGGSDRHVLDLAHGQIASGLAHPAVFATVAPGFADRMRARGVHTTYTDQTLTLRTALELRRLVRETEADIVHAHGYEGTWLALSALIAARRPPRLVVTCHGWLETSRSLRLMSMLDRAANLAAAGIIVVGHNVSATAIATARRAHCLAYVPNGVSTELVPRGSAQRVALGIGGPPVVVGAMGRLSPEKRHVDFIRAAGEVVREHPDVLVALAGGGPLREEVLDLARVSIPADRFRYLGVCDRPESFVANVDVLVQTSATETTSRVVLEAAAQGTCVISTDVGAASAIIEHGVSGLLVPPRDVRATAVGMSRAVASSSLRERLGAEARRTVCQRFGIERMVSDVSDVYAVVTGHTVANPHIWVRQGDSP